MEVPKSNSESVNLLKALREFLSEDDTIPTTTDITRNLQRQGVDFSKTLKDISKHAERAENRLRLKTCGTAFKKAAFQPLERLAASVQELKELVAAQISSLGNGGAAEAFYRKLETAEEEDLRSLLEDFEELKLHAEDESSSGDKPN